MFLLNDRHLEGTVRTVGKDNPVSGTQSEVMVIMGAGALHRGHSASHPGVGHKADGVACRAVRLPVPPCAWAAAGQLLRASDLQLSQGHLLRVLHGRDRQQTAALLMTSSLSP